MAGSNRHGALSAGQSRQKRWSDECVALRQLCLASGLTEALKWGKACYQLDGGNVVLIQSFKDYCALLFMKGALLGDPRGLLVRQTMNVQAARQLRYTALAEINRQKAAIAAYIREAIALEKAGVKVQFKSVAQFSVPEEFKRRLQDDPELARAFGALTPGRQKAYLLQFSDAKQSATRAARVLKHADRILAGMGLDD